MFEIESLLNFESRLHIPCAKQGATNNPSKEMNTAIQRVAVGTIFEGTNNAQTSNDQLNKIAVSIAMEANVTALEIPSLAAS